MLRSPERAIAAVGAAIMAVDFAAGHADDGGWAMAADALSFVRALVMELEPAHVLEFGSGVSTTALAGAAAALPRPAAVSAVENDPAALHSACAAVRSAGDPAPVSVQFAPLAARRVDGRHLPVYLVDTEQLASDAPPDLIVVDGPPAVLGGREGALRQALSFATIGTVVLLDDADRRAEAEAFGAVVGSHRRCVRKVPSEGFTRGMSTLVVTAPVPVRFETDAARPERIA